MPNKPFNVLLLYAQDNVNKTLSYQYGWPRSFQNSQYFNCKLVNLANKSLLKRIGNFASIKKSNADVIIMLHSVFSNACHLTGRLFDAVCQSQTPKVYFIGNEYKNMPEKMAFCEALDLTLLVTQSDSPDVHKLYKDRLGYNTYWLPYTGLDESLFTPGPPLSQRQIDLGYRSFESPKYLGHEERNLLTNYFSQQDLGLTTDISLDPNDRFNETGWAQFLMQCKGQLGSEAGGDFFELTDETRLKVNAYTQKNPQATMSEVYAQFFQNYDNPIPLRVISGRNIEAAGTKTVQILFEGHYNSLFVPDQHYISLKKDFSNIEDVIEKFQDPTFCNTLTENAYHMVQENLTYNKLLDRFQKALHKLI